jgi:hypothetical protein
VAVPEAVDQAAAIPEAEATLAAVAPNLSPPPAELPEPPLDRPPEGDAGGGRRQGAESGSAIVGRGDTGTGPGAGGDGDGAGGGDVFLGGELHARVQGDEHETIVERGDGPAFISDKRATELRTRDYFPRLPGERWPQRRPYVVVLDVCVAGDGTVSDAALRSSASRTLDPIVRAAAKTWRYSPHLVDGRPTPFCHRVVIRYERW